MEKTIEIPEGYEARIEGNKIILEPKESEDERIRKAILELVKQSSHILNPMNQKSMIAWLERQGEQNPANSAETCKNEPKFKVKYAGGEYNVFETKELAGVTFYGIEDEPNHIDYVKAESCEIIGGYTIKENGSPYPTYPAVFSEQKPAWSEEDETGLNDAMWAIEQARTTAKDENDMGNLWYAEKWLKSLKERHTWKPSDEQMEYLAKAITTLGNEGDNKTSAILCELRTDLKKLKG